MTGSIRGSVHFFHFVTFKWTPALAMRRVEGNKWLPGEGDIEGNEPGLRRGASSDGPGRTD